MHLRGENDEYIAAKTTWFLGIPQPREVEVCCLTEAIIWLGNQGLTMISIELDYKQVVDDIFNKIGSNYELGTILNYYKDSLYRLPNFKISFIRRQANDVAL